MPAQPRERPSNLPRIPIDQLPEEPPVALPGGSDDDAILQWAEANRDHFEERGQLLSVGGLKALAERAGLSDDDAKSLRKQLSRIFRDELEAKKAASEEKPAKVKSEKPAKSQPKPKKEKTKVSTATASKPSKPNKAAKPSKNGTEKKRIKVPNSSGESKEIYRMKIRGIPIVVHQTEENMFRVNVGEQTMRKLAQWMGATGWATQEALNVLTRLIANVKGIGANINKIWTKGPEAYVRAVLNEGHMGSGKACASTKFKKPGSFGMAPQTIDRDIAKTLNQMRKAASA